MDPQTHNSGSNDIIVSSGAADDTSSMRCRRGSLPPEGDAVPIGSISGGRSQAEMDLELLGVGSQFEGKRKGKDHGHREKAVAARRAGCKTIIFPKDNMSDWLEDRLQGEKGTDQF
ncbi:hypothetical protein CEP54_013977 [Fusarium duplospermum]|uniref:Lon proteolytic domain-containing protein n=1 Tax=Fusarium duplospermum TaxID=1325734 RepID=A0A428NZK3_9HYPO|nr:hypothetical protein CEP54_013977 [Fusarium duplospermum]